MIDVHSHVQQHDPAELEGILQRASEANVGAIIAAGVTAADSDRCIEIAAEHDELFAGIGIHPTDLEGPLDEPVLARMERAADRKEVVVWSEAGIDHQAHVLQRDLPADAIATGLSWVEIQEQALREQIEIAQRHGLALVFHVREPGDDPDAGSAWPSARSVLDDTDAGRFGGAAHYFQGNKEWAEFVLDAGFMISFARPLLRLQRLQEIARWLPADRIVLESDSYPQPFKRDRTKWTEPRHLLPVAECLAELRGLSIEEVAELTSENALSMLGGHAKEIRQRVR